jgi:hypothetical protein
MINNDSSTIADDQQRFGKTAGALSMFSELTCSEQGRLRFGLSCDVGFCVGKRDFDIRFFCERDNGSEVFVEVFQIARGMLEVVQGMIDVLEGVFEVLLGMAFVCSSVFKVNLGMTSLFTASPIR